MYIYIYIYIWEPRSRTQRGIASLYQRLEIIWKVLLDYICSSELPGKRLKSGDLPVHVLHLGNYIYIYIYIYIYVERERCMYVYIYIYMLF